MSGEILNVEGGTDTGVVGEVENQDSAPEFLSMSDDELLKAGPPTLKSFAAKTEKVEHVEKVEVTDKTPKVETPANDDDTVTEGNDDDADLEGGADDDAAGGKPAKEKVAAESDNKETKVDGTGSEDDKSKDAPAIDYKAAYERLTAPFKANGRDIQVGSVDDAISLMQMGANYNKKMAALKPNLKLMKMLENNGFMSEDKINFLIDLGKKNPDAINKLVQDSGLDPLDLGTDKAKTYKPTAYAVDDREIELDTVLDDLNDSPTYTRTLDVVSNKWDVASKQTISQTPQLLKVINDHMASGVYDLISTEMERERLFGRLNGLSDIEAYRKVGDAIQARGGFNHLAPRQGQPKTPVTVTPPAKPKVDEAALKDKRRAASSTKTAAPSEDTKDFNPLSMSDAEFSKLVKPKFL